MRRYATVIVPVLLLVLFKGWAEYAEAGTTAKKAQIKIVRAEGEAVLGADTTRAQAEAIALNEARRRALEKVGVLVRSETILYNSKLVSDLVVASTRGLIVKERILKKRWDVAGGGTPVYRVTLEAHIKPLELKKRGSLRVLRLAVTEPGKRGSPKSPVFHNGEEIQIRVRVNSRAYLNIFNVAQDGRITKLFPNRYVDMKPLPPGVEFVFPDDELRTIGLKLRVKTPEGLKRAVESVLVIATKEKVDFLASEAQGKTTITDLMRELSDLDPSLWAQKTVGYEVRR